MATQFTSGTSPTTGQGQVWVENTNGEWELARVNGPGVVVTVLTSGSGTFTAPAGSIYHKVTATGGGGGGGGVDSSDGSGAIGGGGGQGGGTAIKLYSAAEMGATASYAVGAAGTAGSDTGGAGGDGGTTTFTPVGSGTALSCDGGDGGDGGTVSGGDYFNTAAGGSVEGTATGGDINIIGGRGGEAGTTSTTGAVAVWPGDGGGSYWGGGGRGNVQSFTSTGSANGFAGEAYGSGGGGAYLIDTTTGAFGAVGASGVIYIESYIRQSPLSPIAYDSNGNEVLDLSTATASAVNYVDIDNAATGNGPTISAAGSDTNIDLNISPKGSGVLNLDFGSANETLSDYEEGAWTPTLTTTGTDFTSVTYGTQSGTYTKIGRLCFIECTIVTSAVTKGSASGNVGIDGSPFTARAGSSAMGPCTNVESWLGEYPRAATSFGGSTFWLLYYRTTSPTTDNGLAVADVSTTTNRVRFAACYQV